jgi:hypothetical protein
VHDGRPRANILPTPEARHTLEEPPKKTRLQKIRSEADEERVLDSAAHTLKRNRADLVLVQDQEGFLVKDNSTNECWKIDCLGTLPEVEPAN